MRKITRTLAIETSCDDTSVAVVSWDGERFVVEKMLAYSQLDLHQQYGGVVPELAARSHLEKILPLIEALGGESLRDEIDSLSVTAYPGLPGALVIGVTAAYTLGKMWNKPVIDVNHIMGHVFSLLADRSLTTMKLPYLCLTVSGGHNDVYLVEKGKVKTSAIDEDVRHKRKHIPLGGSIAVGPYRVTKCAQTMDDAAGEVYDKVARMLGGPYPGGKRVDDVAAGYTGTSPYRFTKPKMPDDQFSLSGIKSQVFNLIHKLGPDGLTEETVAAICWSFGEAVTSTLAEKFEGFLDVYTPATIGLVGGVSANKRLREKMQEVAGDIPMVTPEKFVYCTDNAGMIGVAGLLEAIDLK